MQLCYFYIKTANDTLIQTISADILQQLMRNLRIKIGKSAKHFPLQGINRKQMHK